MHHSRPPDLRVVRGTSNIIWGPWTAPDVDELLDLGRDPEPLHHVLWGSEDRFLLGPPGRPKSEIVSQLFPQRNWFQRKHTIDVWEITNGQFLAFCILLTVLVVLIDATKGWSWPY